VIPTVDLRSPDAAAVDEALQKAGFLLVAGHGVDPALRAALRAEARRFFALPVATKERYAARIGGRAGSRPASSRTGTPTCSGVGRPPSSRRT